MTYGTALRSEVRGPGVTPLIGVYDMYSASLAAQQFGGMFVSGFGFAASYYGMPDIGLIAWSDMVAFVQRLRLAFPSQHLLVDIDDGYGDPAVAAQVAATLERVGASGVILEDQQRPRRCGHAAGKQVLPLEEYLRKLDAVLAVRTDLLVVARTDAVEEPEMLRRAAALAATDADVVLVDGVRSTDLITKVRERVGAKPLLFNQIAGGKSPRLSLSELGELGVDVAIYSTPCLFAAHAAIEQTLSDLHANDGRLADVGVGVAASTRLLDRNMIASQQREQLMLLSKRN
ncbi:carboxyvinyl-carboxyphosphonate phosphorylmutase [Nocardia nova]|uniref:isocitrate lyase/PEP mutase family protein n=1 Tax=Nocardia nova TaxID=37330 RepID=UPI000CE9CF4A|nr:isocitrate lyase/PEP mutase family protein [Nocardia nova]PPJ02120.1 carboxyvinyl-carboxyphosphonate phosphorylmutase [Nocardia nova]